MTLDEATEGRRPSSPETHSIAGAQADVVIGTDDVARFLP